MKSLSLLIQLIYDFKTKIIRFNKLQCCLINKILNILWKKFELSSWNDCGYVGWNYGWKSILLFELMKD